MAPSPDEGTSRTVLQNSKSGLNVPTNFQSAC